jgi:hypothetical protein
VIVWEHHHLFLNTRDDQQIMVVDEVAIDRAIEQAGMHATKMTGRRGRITWLDEQNLQIATLTPGAIVSSCLRADIVKVMGLSNRAKMDPVTCDDLAPAIKIVNAMQKEERAAREHVTIDARTRYVLTGIAIVSIIWCTCCSIAGIVVVVGVTDPASITIMSIIAGAAMFLTFRVVMNRAKNRLARRRDSGR